jgi:MFS family permease
MATDTSHYKWYILTLAAMTHAVVVAIPLMSMPVLFAEIAEELGLNMTEIGWIWGFGFLTGVGTGLIGGAIGDRYGTRRTLMIGCLLAGITGALRGFSNDFASLAFTSFLFGLVPPAIPMSVHKTCGIWFSGRRLGLANGVVSAGMALGFMLGSLLSATVLSPLLGGWRNVLFLQGGLSVVVGIFWFFTRPEPETGDVHKKESQHVPLSRGLPYVARLKDIWLLGLAMLGIGGCINGVLGYLPLYLRNIGWTAASADIALATFHGVSLMATIPIALLSDKLGSRRQVLLVASMMIIFGVTLLSFSQGMLVWAAVIIAGIVRDGFMAILMTLILELKAVGTAYAGTAMGLVMVFSRLGSLISPPLGNSLAAYDLSFPFLIWAGMAVAGFAGLYLLKDAGNEW